MQRPKVKVCGITRREDARMALDAGADYIGINLFQRSPRCVALEAIPELFEEIPPGKRVLVDVATPSDVLDRYRKLGFDYYQIHFSPDISMATLAAWSGLANEGGLWAAPKLGPEVTAFPQVVLEFADTVLVDAFQPDLYGGTGKTADWQRFQDWSTLYQHKNWILAGGLSPDNIRAAVEATAARVVDVNSGVESAPGIKDAEKLKRLFAVLENL